MFFFYYTPTTEIYPLSLHDALPILRSYVQLDLGLRLGVPNEEVDITLDHARRLVAVEHGFADWGALTAYASAVRSHAAAKPVRLVRTDVPLGVPNGMPNGVPIVAAREWDVVLDALAASPS